MSFGEDIAKIQLKSEIPSNSLIFLPRWQHHDGILLAPPVGKEADGGVASLLLVIA